MKTDTKEQVMSREKTQKVAVKEKPKVKSTKAKTVEVEVAKPTTQSKKNARPYLELATNALEKGLYTRKEFITAIMTAFPQCSKGGVETFVTDLKNPKYCFFKERSVVMQADGKLIFSDVVPAIDAAEAEAVHGELETGTVANGE
jgi:hypothetical protein